MKFNALVNAINNFLSKHLQGCRILQQYASMNDLSLFTVTEPQLDLMCPIVVSSPHSGVNFPDEVLLHFDPQHLQFPADTDWFIHQLYDFAPSKGVTLIRANYSRYVVDLNRDPKSRPLYQDGRKETQLVPTHSFSGAPLYRVRPPTDEEIKHRYETYYQPYHAKLREILTRLRQRFPHVLLFDAHSIRRVVESIQTEPFSDLILGNQNGQTCAPSLFETALGKLESSEFNVSNNHPFRGGFITRSFGNPSDGIHSIQLEMSQDLYMDEDQREYQPKRAEKIRRLLIELFETLKVQLRQTK